jgi:hypothetical protein
VAAARRQLARAGLPAGTLDATRGFLNPRPYSSARSAVVDVTQGNNDVFGPGMVNATRLAQALARAGH